MTTFSVREGVEASAREAGSLWVLELKGDLSTFTETRLREAYRQAAEAGAKHVLLNCAEVGYMSSSGIAVLIDFLREAQEHDRTLMVGGLNAHYRKVFQMMGLTQYLTLVADEDEAQATAQAATKTSS